MKNDETIYTGFTELDKLTGGFKRGELILIAGRPAMGKTAFAMDIARNIREYSKKYSLLYINETLPQREDIEEEWKLWYLIPFSLDLLIIDDLEHIKCSKLLNKKENLRQILTGLKNLAVELNIPVVVLSQLSKSVEKRDDKHPIITDLNYSSMNEIPDKILFLYREDYYDLSNPERNGTVEIIVAKNQDGKTDTVNLLYDKEKHTFKNIEENVFIFNQISSVNKNSFTAKYYDYWIEADTKGNILYKIKCQNLRRINDNLLIAKVNNKEGLIDNDFNVISGFKYSDFKTLDKNFQYFKFRKNKKWGVVDRQGTIIIEPKYSKLERADKNFNYMFVKVNDKEYLIDRHENIIDAETEDKLICTPDFIENIEHSINSNWRIVEINGKYGLVDKAFNQLKININNIAKILEKQINFFDRDSYTIEV